MAVQLNLARKWRSKQFNQIVGQDLSVRMLQNSLYLDQIFPVYLFSGQRGCGKTTTARIFAAAVNCQNLQEFRKEPKKHTIPCLICASCLAMATGSHPDFIEIDAASHTGVDNVRQIIDAASLLPVMGRKRLYLIDEAHMLSKAAFNAFLKILEEPPASVVFMLATTDPEKIIETVRSRCFQLFFPAIDKEALLNHLQEVCKIESIQAEEAALRLIIKEAEGSARDALNILEQVRFSHAQVSKQAVINVLGYLPDSLLLDLLLCLAMHDEKALIVFFENNTFEKYNPLALWTALQEMVRILLLVTYGVHVDHEHNHRLQEIARVCSHEQILSWLQCLYDHELLLLKSTAQYGILQMMLLKMCGFDKKVKDTSPSQPHHLDQEYTVQKVSSSSTSSVPSLVLEDNKLVQDTKHTGWQAFLADVKLLSDPLVVSLFKQVIFKDYKEDTQEVVMTFTQTTPLFKEWVHESQAVWLAVLRKNFGEQVKAVIHFEKLISSGEISSKEERAFDKGRVVAEKSKPIGQSSHLQHRVVRSHVSQETAIQGKSTRHFDASDKEKWKMANQLLETFGGTLVEVEGEQ